MPTYQVTGDVPTLAKRIMYLAWKACGGPSGLGFLQDRGDLTEDQFWEVMYNCEDYPGGNAFRENAPAQVYADYVAGRMMKLGLKWDGQKLSTTGMPKWRPDYQSFCTVYPTFDILLEAALQELPGISATKT